MALIAPRRLGQLRPMTQSRLNGRRLRSPTRLPSPVKIGRNVFFKLLRWMFGTR